MDPGQIRLPRCPISSLGTMHRMTFEKRYGRCIAISAATARAGSRMCHTTTSSIVSQSQGFVTEFLIGTISILLVRRATLRRATSGAKRIRSWMLLWIVQWRNT